jgi:uncharacterized protein (DUF2235 family)
MSTNVIYQQAKIIICCDGTSNSEYIEKNPLTNVSRIARCIPPKDNDGKRQLVYYQPGIGTDNGNPLNAYNQAVGRGSGPTYIVISDLLIRVGRANRQYSGLDQMVIEAYSFICNNYSAVSQDQIILIGFSRGAFAVRCIADLVGQVGVLRKDELHRVHEIYKSWKSPVVPRAASPPRNAIGHQARITACAVWDTVSSIGIPLPRYFWHWGLRFVHSDVCHSIDFAFQALALHEHRYHFCPIIWRDPQTIWSPQKLEQCWFSGYHADAGGGNAEDALAHFALGWMISKLKTWVQFDAAGFCNPSLPRGSWTIGGDAGVRPADNSCTCISSLSPAGSFLAVSANNTPFQTASRSRIR